MKKQLKHTLCVVVMVSVLGGLLFNPNTGIISGASILVGLFLISVISVISVIFCCVLVLELLVPGIKGLTLEEIMIGFRRNRLF